MLLRFPQLAMKALRGLAVVLVFPNEQSDALPRFALPSARMWIRMGG